MNANSMRCCGVKELTELSGTRDPAAALMTMLNYLGRHEYGGPGSRTILHFPAAHIIFTGVTKTRSNYGERFANFIRENNLGEVIESVVKRNPNSGNPLKVWVWSIHRNNLEAWWKERRK